MWIFRKSQLPQAVVLIAAAFITLDLANGQNLNDTKLNLTSVSGTMLIGTESSTGNNETIATRIGEDLSAVSEPQIVNVNSSSIISEADGATAGSKPKRTCACEDNDAPLCGSNGITYKNSCRFDCAKARVTRLRVIRKGQCSQSTGAAGYWQNRRSLFSRSI